MTKEALQCPKVSIFGKKKGGGGGWHYSTVYVRNDLQHCFPVALTDCTRTKPWKVTLTAAHPWANQKAVQNNGLLLQSCHLRGRHVQGAAARNTTGVCLDMTIVDTPSPLAMEDETERRRAQKQVLSARKNASTKKPQSNSSGKKMLNVYIIFIIATLAASPPPNALTQTLIRQCYEWNLEVHVFLICSQLCTVAALPYSTIRQNF